MAIYCEKLGEQILYVLPLRKSFIVIYKIIEQFKMNFINNKNTVLRYNKYQKKRRLIFHIHFKICLL